MNTQRNKVNRFLNEKSCNKTKNYESATEFITTLKNVPIKYVKLLLKLKATCNLIVKFVIITKNVN